MNLPDRIYTPDYENGERLTSATWFRNRGARAMGNNADDIEYIRADLVAKWTAGIPQAALEAGIVAEMIEFIKIVSLDEKWDKSGSNWGPWIPTRNAISARAVLSKLTSGEG